MTFSPPSPSYSLYTSEKPYLEFWEEGFNFHSSFSSSKVALFVSFTFSSGGIKFSIINVLRKRKTNSSAFVVVPCTHYLPSYWLRAKTRAPYSFLDTNMLTSRWSIYTLRTMRDCELSASGTWKKTQAERHSLERSLTDGSPRHSKERAWVQANWFSPWAISVLSLKIIDQLYSVR